MSNEPKCAECGAPLSPGTPEGLCPACLLKRGLETQTAGAGLAADFIPPTPEELARYFPQLEILELLGRGGMGVVYKARQRELDRIVALKILPSAADRDPAFAERFGREARALARLDHPNIVAVFDFGQTTGGLYYFVMEYVDGLNLRQLLTTAKITPREALAIVPQICDALQTAHDQGIVHRDIKPENILLDKRGRVKIADFGIAKIVGGQAPDITLTGAGEVMGTPVYMAPEQIEHPREVDHRADIYSLGVVFYQMLTGELPLGKFAPPSRKVQIDVRLDAVVLRALEKEPELRFQQAGEVKTQIETIASTNAPPQDTLGGSPVEERPLMAQLSRNAWSLVPLVAVVLAFFNRWGERAWYDFAAGCAILAVLQGFGARRRGAKRSAQRAVDPTPITPAQLERARWLILARALILCMVAAVFGIFTRPPILGIALVSWGLVGFVVVSRKTLGSRRNQDEDRAALKAANQIGVVYAIGILAAGLPLYLNSGMTEEWAVFFAMLMGCGIIICLLKLSGLWPFGSAAFRTRPGTGLLSLAAGVCAAAFFATLPLLIARGPMYGFSHAARTEEVLQENVCDIQPDGTVHDQTTMEIVNQTGQTIWTNHFVNSDFVHVDKIYDQQGRSLAFEARPGKGSHIEYDVTLNEPVTPGNKISVTTEAIETGLIKATGEPGVFEFSMNHWPGYDGVTHRIELHRLPPGAELIDKSPDDLKAERVGNHIELRIDRRIPPGGHIELRYRYRLANGQAIERRDSKPAEQVLEEYDWQGLAAKGQLLGGSPVTVDGRSGLKIENKTDAPLQLSLLKIEKPPVTSMNYALTGEIRYEDVHGAGYLVMWNDFPEGRFFSRTLGTVGLSGPMGQIAGTSNWRTFTLPFNRTGSAGPPARLEFNIFLPGRGVVFIGPLKLTQAAQPMIEQVINVRSDGSFVFDHQSISGNELTTRLRELGKIFPDQAVIIRGDQNVDYQSIVKVLDICRQTNIWNVAFATAQTAHTTSPTPSSTSH